MRGIVEFGTYLPRFRLARTDIVDSLWARGGWRSVAAFDEDTTSMGVEAARRTLSAARPCIKPRSILFSTAAPAYRDKTNATAIHAALGAEPHVAAYDLGGALRSSAGCLRLALADTEPSLVVMADVRSGLPGSQEEADGGDAAAALLIGGGPAVLAELLGWDSSTVEVLDRWRSPESASASSWEDRFGEHVIAPVAAAAASSALAKAGLDAARVDRVVLSGANRRALRSTAALLSVKPEAVVDLEGSVGRCGAADLAVQLCHALETSKPGEVMLVVSVADGADAFVFRATDELAQRGSRLPTVADQADQAMPVSYLSYLSWRGVLQRELPRRPEPPAPAAPPSWREHAWKFAFVGSRCQSCGTRHLPRRRVCLACGTKDQMDAENFSSAEGTVTTCTVDHLTFSLNPPVYVGVIDFDGGGRIQCELTDVPANGVQVGDRVEMTFRRHYTTDGIHNYFWKARPARTSTRGT